VSGKEVKDGSLSMTTLLITGGDISKDFALSYISDLKLDLIIGVDSGAEFLYSNQITPTHVVGDFDTASKKVVNYYLADPSVEVSIHKPEKDATDTQLAIELAMGLNSDEIIIMGGIGSRMDHTLSNIHNLYIPAQKGIKCFIINEKNRISLLKKSTIIYKKNQFGTYFSLLPLSTTVEGLTLKGFKYPLEKYTMEKHSSIGISNELIHEVGSIEFSRGILLLIESED